MIKATLTRYTLFYCSILILLITSANIGLFLTAQDLESDKTVALLSIDSSKYSQVSQYLLIPCKSLQVYPNTHQEPQSLGILARSNLARLPSLPIGMPIVTFLQKDAAHSSESSVYVLNDNSWIPFSSNDKLQSDNSEKLFESIDQGVLDFLSEQMDRSGNVELLSVIPEATQNARTHYFAEDNTQLLLKASDWLFQRRNVTKIVITDDLIRKMNDRLLSKNAGNCLELIELVYIKDPDAAIKLIIQLDSSPALDEQTKLNLPHLCAQLITKESIAKSKSAIVLGLSSNDPRLRRFIARALVQIGTSESTALLLPLLNTTDVDLQYEAIRGISQFAMSKGINLHQPSIMLFKQDPVNSIARYKLASKSLGL